MLKITTMSCKHIIIVENIWTKATLRSKLEIADKLEFDWSRI